MDIWKTNKGEFNLEFRFNYNFDLVQKFIDALPEPSDQSNYLADLASQFNMDETERFSAPDRFTPDSSKTGEENKALYNDMMAASRLRFPKPQPYFAAQLQAKIEIIRAVVETNNNQNGISHREHILIDQYLVAAGLVKPKSAKELKAISSKRYLASLSFIPGSKSSPFKETSRAELTNVITHLAEYPAAAKLAEKDLKTLK